MNIFFKRIDKCLYKEKPPSVIIYMVNKKLIKEFIANSDNIDLDNSYLVDKISIMRKLLELKEVYVQDGVPLIPEIPSILLEAKNRDHYNELRRDGYIKCHGIYIDDPDQYCGPTMEELEEELINNNYKNSKPLDFVKLIYKSKESIERNEFR